MSVRMSDILNSLTQGPTGPTGPQGPQGVTGPTGPTATFSSLSDTNISSPGTGEVPVYNATAGDWENNTLEEGNIVSRDEAALDANIGATHTTYSAISTGTRTITMLTQPSVYQPISGSSVTFNFVTTGISLPERGLADIKLGGKIFVKVTATSITGIAVTLDSATTNRVYLGDPPLALNKRGVLAWEYFDDGTNEMLIATWVTEE